jgi:hypothetical protein
LLPTSKTRFRTSGAAGAARGRGLQQSLDVRELLPDLVLTFLQLLDLLAQVAFLLLLRQGGASEKQRHDKDAGAFPQVESAHYKLSSPGFVGIFNILDAARGSSRFAKRAGMRPPSRTAKEIRVRVLLGTVFTASILGSFSLAWTSSDEANAPALRPLLLNGGQRPAWNYLSHLHHVEGILGLLERRGIAADLIVRDTLPADFWLIDGTEVGKTADAPKRAREYELERKAGGAAPATLKRWFETSGRELEPGEPLFSRHRAWGRQHRRADQRSDLALEREADGE